MSQSIRPARYRTQHVWVPVSLVLCAVVLACNPFEYTQSLTPAAPAPAWATDTTPVRQPKLSPEYTVGVFQYRCSECHKIIASPPETSRPLTQHLEVHLAHGINTRCFNCHHRTNRDAFVDDYGQEIPWDQPQLLCGKCHGPVYRDWQHGAHGRTNGYWDRAQGTQTRRRCIECHDPHQPPFAPLVPAPGPHTFRMGPQGLEAGHEGHNPLRLHRPATADDLLDASTGKD